MSRPTCLVDILPDEWFNDVEERDDAYAAQGLRIDAKPKGGVEYMLWWVSTDDNNTDAGVGFVEKPRKEKPRE